MQPVSMKRIRLKVSVAVMIHWFMIIYNEGEMNNSEFSPWKRSETLQMFVSQLINMSDVSHSLMIEMHKVPTCYN
jgi:hypothetical protein